ncbi:hypothetical protein HYX01_04910 [Candidatus Woesearchaeota archaeon]|nr:hypothetical protein [Candidatus Woesearchaeota archaeon]
MITNKEAIKDFLKPNKQKIVAFLFIFIAYSYFAKENVCGASFFFAFCYKAYGYPFFMVTGDINPAFEILRSEPLANYFSKFGNFLFNPFAFIINLALVYLMGCFAAYIYNKLTLKKKPLKK